MPRIINWDLAKHPLNWIIVFLMVLIAAVAFNLIMKWEAS